MSRAWVNVGCRATIVNLEFSPAATCAHRYGLLGREGLVVAVLRNGGAALLRLDGDECDLPQGIRRWVVVWDDLEIHEPAGAPQTPAYVTGFSKRRRVQKQHAVVPGTKVAICSEPVRPLPFCGWSLAFSPTAPRTCPDCLALLGRNGAEVSITAP